jgi:rod shape-determining protein MreD
MGYYLAIPLLALAAALESSVLPFLRLYNGQPGMVLLMVLCWGLHAPLEEALFWAFIGGIFQDLLSITPLGTSTIALVIVLFGAEIIRKQVYRVSIITLMGMILGGTILHQVVVFIVLSLIGAPRDLGEVLTYILVPEIFYNLVLMLPVYVILRVFQRRIHRPELTV